MLTFQVASKTCLLLCFVALSESPKCLLCSPSTLHNHPPTGLVSRARIIVSQCGDYDFQVFLRTKVKGTVTCEEELCHLRGMLSKSSGYKFCPGLSKVIYNDKYASVLQNDYKSVRLMLGHSTVWIPHSVSYGTSLLRTAAYLKWTWKRCYASPARRW